jgi:hypothetical protein
VGATSADPALLPTRALRARAAEPPGRRCGASPTEEGGQLTPSLKLKGNVVLRENKDDVAALYT